MARRAPNPSPGEAHTRSMKRQIEKPSDHPMRFFTPELYVRFNSPDENEADRANEEWDAAIDRYTAHLAALHGKMPHHVAKLAEVSLHDAELLARDQSSEPISVVPGEPA